MYKRQEKTEGQTVSTSLKDFDGKTTTNVKKAVDAYFNAVLLGGESKDYSKFVSNDLDKAKGELNQYFSDSLQYSYDDTDHIKPTGDEIPKVFGWVQTANRERGSYTVDNIIVAKDKACLLYTSKLTTLNQHELTSHKHIFPCNFKLHGLQGC